MDRDRQVQRVLWWVLGANLLVALAKIIVGRLAGSVSLQADGLHSVFDGSSNIVGLVAIRIARKPPDLEHPYGHRKAEVLASMLIGGLIVLGLYEIGGSAYEALVTGRRPTFSFLALAVVLGTLAANIFVALLERRAGRRLKSPLLLADARHTASDVLATISVLAALIGVKLGFPFLDLIAAFVVMVVVATAALAVFKEAMTSLMDAARLDPEEVRREALSVKGAWAVSGVRSRGTAGEIFVDLKLKVDPGMSVQEAHTLAHEVERALLQKFKDVREVVVHIEPGE